MKLSIRTPPTLDTHKAMAFTAKELTRDPPYNAHVTCKTLKAGYGWNAGDMGEKTKNLIE